MIKAIMENHKNQKGIIHTHSNKIAYYLKNNIKSKRLLEAFQNTFQLIGFTIGLYFVKDVLELNLIEIGFLGYVYIKLYTHLANILKKYQVLTNNITYLRDNGLKKFALVSELMNSEDPKEDAIMILKKLTYEN